MRIDHRLTFLIGTAALLFGLGCQPVAQNVKGNATELYSQGRYAEAIPIAQSDLAAAEKAGGPKSLEAAEKANMLGRLYYSVGNFTEAVPLLRRALTVRENRLGSGSSETAATMYNLAMVYDGMTDYARAEPLYKRSLAVRESRLGSDHPDVAAGYNHLFRMYYHLGDFAQAIPVLQKTIRMKERSLGPNHPDVAAGLSTLAAMNASLGRFGQAESLYNQALDRLGSNSSEAAAVYSGLAYMYQEKGDFTRAAELYQKALSTQESRMGSGHPDVAAGYNNLALLYRQMGDTGRAVSLSGRALSAFESVYGPEHPEVASALDNLAGLYAAQGDYAKAFKLFKRAQTIDARLIDHILGFSSAEKKSRFLAAKRSSLEGFLSLVAMHLRGHPEAPTDALNAWLARKGILIEAQRRFQESVAGSDDPRTREAFQSLAMVQAQLSRLTFAGPGDGSKYTYRRRMEQLEKEKERLETELIGLSRAFAAYKQASKADAKAVAQAMPPGSVLIEFARINIFNYQGSGLNKWLPAHYLAFVLPAGPEARVTLVDLGEAWIIDQAVTRLKKTVSNLSDKDGTKVGPAARRAYDVVLGPLSGYIGGADRVFISPDGNLNLIPFEIFQSPDGLFLIDRFAFNYLSAGRDVLTLGKQGGRGSGAVIVGDPDFGLTAAEKRNVLTKLDLAQTNSWSPGPAADLRGFQFGRLPGTREEVEAIEKVLSGARVYTGGEALEEVLRRMDTPRYLHLATRSFFLGDVQFLNLTGHDRSAGQRARFANPLLRSGLALAGANRALADVAGTGDGVLTADKILGLPLRGTDLVVLSACDTGSGRIQSGEGVYGLRRAFTQAGVRSLVMSMWTVPDRETGELMVEFYRNLTGTRMNRAEALRAAALKQRQTVKERYGHDHPFFWGAFVFMGQP